MQKKQPSPGTLLSVRIRPVIKAHLDHLAITSDMTLSEYIRLVLDSHVLENIRAPGE